MKVKTSISLSEDLVEGMDALLKKPGLPSTRSAFLEEALRNYNATAERQARDSHDLGILNRRSRKLNREAADTLSHQTDL